MSTMININRLSIEGLQSRVKLDEQVVTEYMEAADKMPPVIVYTDGKTRWLADGFHRVEAYKRKGIPIIAAEERQGTFLDALRFSLQANSKHGLRRSNEDKNNALSIAWEKRQELFGGTPSVGMLANACQVSEPKARDFINAHAPKMPTREGAKNLPPQMVIGKDGKTYPAKPTQPPSHEIETARKEVLHDSNGAEHCVPVDRYDVEIPIEIQPSFDDKELSKAIDLLNEARRIFKDSLNNARPGFAALRQEALIELDNVLNYAKDARPHCVCRMCQGNGCKACGARDLDSKNTGRGWQTRSEYDRNPSEFKAESAGDKS